MPLKIDGQPLPKKAATTSEPEITGEPLETLPMPVPEGMPVASNENDGTAEPAEPPPVRNPTPNELRFGDNYDPETDSYQIGKYRAPPEHRIRPGEVRSPRGRGKGNRNRATLLREALDEKVTVDIRGRKLRITRLDLTYRTLATKAAKGDLRAAEFVHRIAEKLLPETDEQRAEEPLTEAELAILRRIRGE